VTYKSPFGVRVGIAITTSAGAGKSGKFVLINGERARRTGGGGGGGG